MFDWDADTAETGPIFGGECEDLDYTLLQWTKGLSIQPHINNEVDVIMIVFAGSGIVTVDDQSIDVSKGKTLVIPKGAKRSIQSTSNDFRYLNIHKRRRSLMPV